MTRYSSTKIPLINPVTNEVVRLNDSNEYESFSGIPDLFVGDQSDLTSKQAQFYEKVNFPNYEEFDNLSTLISKTQKNSFIRKLDNEIPLDSSILEVGCGTGQMSLFLGRHNRIVHSIDLSKASLQKAENFRKQNGIENVFFFRMNLFQLFYKKESFDVIISMGVLHHTDNAKRAFENLVPLLKKDGLIIIGLYHRYGRTVTKLKQQYYQIFKRPPSSSEKERTWFFDQFKNPFESTHTLNETLGWFEENNIQYLSSIPFNFDENTSLFKEQDPPDKVSLFFDEISQMFSRQQIKEGGFFVVIGRKK